MKEEKKKLHFAKLDTYKNTWADYREKNQGDYVKSGDDNQFPNYLINLYNRSSIHAACVNAITEAIIGGGLQANEDVYLEQANKKGESWNDIFSKISIDYYLHGAFAIELIWSLDRTRVAEAYHIDYSTVRSGNKDHRGNISEFYISEEWKSYTKADDEHVICLPTFNPLTKHDEPSQMYVSRNFRPGQKFYPLPVYNGALKVVELDVEIDNFHVNNIKNGLAPSIAITTFTNGSDDDVQAVEAMLKANYGGSDNAGSLIYMDVDSPENAPKIEPIPSNGTDTYYTDINDMSTQKILTAHRITSPMMLGIKTAGQLGGREEVIDAFLLFQNTVIAPYQQDILKCLEYILSFNYPSIVLGVETKKLYDDGSEEEEVVTSVEVTDQEDADMQEDETANPIL